MGVVESVLLVVVLAGASCASAVVGGDRCCRGKWCAGCHWLLFARAVLGVVPAGAATRGRQGECAEFTDTLQQMS